MKKDMTIKEIEQYRMYLSEAMVHIINQYEETTGMCIEAINIKEDRTLYIFDRLGEIEQWLGKESYLVKLKRRNSERKKNLILKTISNDNYFLSLFLFFRYLYKCLSHEYI